jgi:integrase/recombinase XerD
MGALEVFPTERATRSPATRSPQRPAGTSPTWIDMWLRATLERSGSRETHTAYARALRRFQAWWGDRPLLAVRPADAVRYAEYLRTCGLAPSSQSQAIAAMRSLYGFAARSGVLPSSPFQNAPTPKVGPRAVTSSLEREDIEQMLAVARPRPQAVLLLLATTGLRISEALDARWSDTFTDERERTGLRVAGRGRARTVKLLPAVVDALAAIRQGEYLLPARDGGRWTKQGADAMLARLAKRAEIGKPVSAEGLRRFLATHALAGGAPLVQVQQDLGHAALATTQRYLRAGAGLEMGSADFLHLQPRAPAPSPAPSV